MENEQFQQLLLNELRELKEGQQRIEQRVGHIEEKTDQTNQRLEILEQRTGRMEEKTDQMNQRLEALEQRVGRLEQKTDSIQQQLNHTQKLQDLTLRQIELILHQNNTILDLLTYNRRDIDGIKAIASK